MRCPAGLDDRTVPARPALRLALVLILLTALPASGLTVRFKISGSYGRPGFDDVNASLLGWADALRKQAAVTPDWNYLGGKDGLLGRTYGLEGEVVLDLSPLWSLGIGAGYGLSEISEGATTLDIVRSSIPYNYARPIRVSATPLFFSGYRAFPIGSRLGLYIGAGAGRIRIRYSAGDAVKRAATKAFSYTDPQEASGRGNLVQAIAGVRYVHDANLGIFVEGIWRRAKVDTLGNGTGTLYAFEEYRPDLDFWQAKLSIRDAPPSGEAFRSVRKAVMDPSGFVAKAGFFIKF